MTFRFASIQFASIEFASIRSAAPGALPGAAPDPLPLLDVHLPPSPSWWPPPAGWWLVLLAIALVVAIVWYRRRRARRLREDMERLFDAGVDAAEGFPARIAAMSELLRRAARRSDPDAVRLAGDAWLRFLDQGQPMPVFSAGAGRTLLEGGFRRDVGEQEYAALRGIVRARFVELMQGKGARSRWSRLWHGRGSQVRSSRVRGTQKGGPR